MAKTDESHPLPGLRPALLNDQLTRPNWTVRQRTTDNVLPLDKNENTDPEFLDTVRGILDQIPTASVLEYPDTAEDYAALAAYLGIDPQNLLFTHGSDGAIRFAFEAFAEPGAKVVQTDPSFAMYPVYSQIYGAEPVFVTYTQEDGVPSLSFDKLCKTIESAKPRLVCLPNPDSPTGTILQFDEIETLCQLTEKLGSCLLIDEAYHPFSKITALPLIATYRNLIVTRTFAKAWGLAGLRLGYLAAHEDLARFLHKIRPMYEVNGLALRAMRLLLERHDEVVSSVDRILEGGRHFQAAMQARGLKTFDCQGNFVLVDFGDGKEAVFQALADKVLYKQQFGHPSLAGFSRFTTAPVDVMNKLIDLIDEGLGKGP